MSRFITATLDGIEITRAKDVKKHGEHDQSSHGAWATGTVVDVEKKPIPKNELQRDVDKGEQISAQIKLGDKSLKVTQKNEKYPDGTVVMNLYVTDKDDNKVGYLGASTQFNDNKFATITNVKVRSEYRRQGVATAMLNFARSHMMDGLEIKHDTNRLSPEGEAWSRVTKHGDHDQSSHGNWAHGVEVAPEVVRSTLDKVKENGGLSVNLKDGSEPTKGFMVAKGKKFAAIVKADEFFDEAKGAEILSSYMKQHKAEFNNSNNYLGLWHNTEDGQVYLDVSENIQDEAEATSRGRERDQISIWDVANFKEIPTGGTGGIEKTRGGSTSRYIEDDRRRDRKLRQRDLGEVSKTFSATKVIYFEFGLKPVLKHGEHDQSEHGNWARGYTDEERTRMEAMKDRGPSIDDLNNVMSEPREIDTDEIKSLIENDSDLYSQATEDIDSRVAERLAALQAEFPNHEYSEQEKATIYEDVQREMIEGYAELYQGDLEERIRIEEGSYSENDPQELQPYFDEVYGISHTGKNPDGVEHTLNSTIHDVSRDGNNLYIRGTITNEDGEEVGEIARRFFQKNGVWNVEHEVLAIMDDDYKGTGFGQELIKQSEAWYTAKGFGFIEVGTAWDGARHWARAGYDFRPDKLEQNISEIATNAGMFSNMFNPDTPAGKQFDSLMGRAVNDYKRDEYGRPTWTSIKDIKSDDFPIPADFANIGYTKGARDWAGKQLMDGLRMKYVKVLTAEGQKLLEGPIDLDGDGLVYDGTAREKPAPSRGNK